MIKRFWIVLFATVPVTGCLLQPPPVMTGVPSSPPSVTVTNTLLSESHSASTRTVTPAPVPIATSTRVLFPSVTAAGTEARITPAPLVPLSDVSFPGRIYGWVSPFYGYLDPNQPVSEVLNTFPVSEDADPGSAASWALAFSAYTNQVAYIRRTPDDQSISLWVSDLQLRAPVRVWTDTTGQSGYSGVDDQISLRWGIRDQFVFLKNHPANVHDNTKEIFWLVYSIRTQSIIELSESCNKLILSPQTAMYALACPVVDGFVVLEQDGTYWETEALPELLYDIQNYAFSPDGKGVLYVDPENAIHLLTASDSPTKFPVRYPENVWFKDMPLQWSLDNNRVLILGYDAPDEKPHCVWDDFTEKIQPCWHLFDASTGERLWWLQQVGGDRVASLSPDGRWVAINYTNYSDFPIARELIAYDTTQPNAGKIVWFWTVDAIHWGD